MTLLIRFTFGLGKALPFTYSPLRNDTTELDFRAVLQELKVL